LQSVAGLRENYKEAGMALLREGFPSWSCLAALRAVGNAAVLFFTIIAGLTQPVMAQPTQFLQTLEPGIGFSQFKQWAIERKLVFEAFTKDSLIVRDTGMQQSETVRIQARFCGGDDYSGKASSIIVQQLFGPRIDAVGLQRDYVEFLSGKAAADGKFAGTFSVRRDRNDGSGEGLAISQEGKAGFWEVGLFKKADYALIQTVRRKDAVCQ
jgi:hypothetical protein